MDRKTEQKPRLIDQQGRVALPREVLDALKAERGDYVVFHVERDRVSLRRVEWK